MKNENAVNAVVEDQPQQMVNIGNSIILWSNENFIQTGFAVVDLLLVHRFSNTCLIAMQCEKSRGML